MLHFTEKYNFLMELEQGSWYRDQDTGCTTAKPWFDSLKEKGIFTFPK